jgi:hypothetical protein
LAVWSHLPSNCLFFLGEWRNTSSSSFTFTPAACRLAYYRRFRPQQGPDNVPIRGDLPPQGPIDRFRFDEVVCHESPGGLLRHYERRGA